MTAKPKPRVLTPAECAARASRPLAEQYLEQLQADPAKFAAHMALRERGWKLWARGGLAAMNAAIDKMDTPDMSRAAVAWDGIGNPDRPNEGFWH